MFRIFRNTALTYTDVLASRFGEREFTTKEFASLVDSTRPAKLLSELKFRGVVGRVGRGSYRCLKPSEKPDLRMNEWSRVRSIILRNPMPKSWTGATAVEIWTDGKYKLIPNLFLRVFYLGIRESDIDKWKTYLKSHGVSYEGKKRVGAFVRLIPTSRLRHVYRHGEPVIPLKDTIDLIRERPGLYAGAEELIGNKF